MIEAAREIQLPLLAAVLLLGSAGKLAACIRHRESGSSAFRTGWRADRGTGLAGLEAVLGVALLLAAGWLGTLASVATALLFGGAAVVLIRLWRRSPDSGCGCFGGLSTTPVDWRAISRAGLLAAAALAAAGAAPSGAEVAPRMTLEHWSLLTVELAVLAAVSPELIEAWRRLRRPDPCGLREVPLRRTLARLRSSDVWRANTSFVEGREPVDVWRYGCWRFLRFQGRREGRDAEMVFAVGLSRHHPPVRAVLTDAENGTVLAEFGKTPAHNPAPHVTDARAGI